MINPVLDEGVFSWRASSAIMGFYFKKLQFKEVDKVYYKTDELLNFYFKDCLTLLEQESNFNRNKMRFNQIQKIIHCGIEKNLTRYQKAILSSKTIINMTNYMNEKIKIFGQNR